MSSTLKFNASRDNYRELITNIRNALKESGRFSHNRPVLPPRSQVAPKDWLDLELSTDDKRTVTLKIRKENLYLDGYKVNKDDKTDVWYEFKNTTPDHLIPGSTFLAFDGSYAGMTGGGGGKLEEKSCSFHSVVNAINGLSKSEGKSEDKASYLMLLIVVVCEATRFESLSSSFADAIRNGSNVEVKFDDVTVDLIHGWGDLSEMMIKADAKGGETIRLPKDNKLEKFIQNPTKAADYVGLLLGSLDYQKTNVRALMTSNASTIPKGQPMAEVFSIKTLVASESLSGTIKVSDGLGLQTLFEGDKKAVKSGETLSLKTLERAISAGMFFEISYDITNKPGREYWSIFQVTDLYDRQITKRNESIELSYVIFPDAWQLTWAAKAEIASREKSINVDGTVTASYTYEGTKYETKLFSRLSGDSEKVAIGENLPLMRVAGAAPVGVEVAVEVSLSDHVAPSSPHFLGKGRETFRVGDGDQLEGSYVLRFAGTDGSSVTVSAAYSRVSQPPK